MSVPVSFLYLPGVMRIPFTEVTLTGSWDLAGRPSGGWSSAPMTSITATDGSPGFTATVDFDPSAVGTTLTWGVEVTGTDGKLIWGIPAEVPDAGSQAQTRSFVLSDDGNTPPQVCRLSWHRARGAVAVPDPSGGDRGVQFSAWAPNASAVEVVFGGPSGYIADNGSGAAAAPTAIPMRSKGKGVWQAEQPDFDSYVGRPYVYRVTRDDGTVNMGTDLWSRAQFGSGDTDPNGAPYAGSPAGLDGRAGCSVVVDTTLVGSFPPNGQPPLPDGRFWADEFSADRPVPDRVEDLVIYELHIGALNPTTDTAGTFADALDFLDYIDDLGVKAVELMPMFQFDTSSSWGYGSSHFLAIESSAGGRDGLLQFVKACHQRGIAVLLDVVFNHYTNQANRAEWHYDSNSEHLNSYYW